MNLLDEVPTLKYDVVVVIGENPVAFQIDAANDLSAASMISTLCSITATRNLLVSGYSVRKPDGTLVVHVPVFSLISAAGPHLNKAAKDLVIPAAAAPSGAAFDKMRDEMRAANR